MLTKRRKLVKCCFIMLIKFHTRLHKDNDMTEKHAEV